MLTITRSLSHAPPRSRCSTPIAYAGIIASAAAPLGKTEVFVTAGGDKYHRAGCRYLKKTKVAISLADAAKKYEPCSVCKPPLADGAPTDPGDKKAKDKPVDVKVDASYLETMWGIKFKSLRAGPSNVTYTLVMEFSKDVDKLKDLRAALEPGANAQVVFVLYDHENVIIGRTNHRAIEGELTGKKEDAFRIVLQAVAGDLQKVFMATRKIVVRPAETKQVDKK